MEPFPYHVFICDQVKPEKVPGCRARGSAETIDALRREVASHGLIDVVQITTCGSLGLCERGPNMVVYPEGIWYSGVTADLVPEVVKSHFVEGKPVERLVNRDAAALKGEIQLNRGKYVASMKAKDAAGALPDDLAQTLRGFQESRVVLTAVELDVFTAVGDGATAAEVAKKIGAKERGAAMLLDALAAMGLLKKEGATYRTTPVTKRFFVAGGRDDARVATMHGAHLWHRWSTLTECVKAGTSVSAQEPKDRGPEWTDAFIAAMHRNAAERAPLVVRAVGVQGVGRMLDVGGGSGAYSIAFAQAAPELRAEIFDLPAVLPIAERHVKAAGLDSRVATRAGDLRTDALGNGFDLVFVSAICHMLSPGENRDLIRRCAAALAPKGRLVIQDFVLNADKAGPKWAALFSLNMLVGTKEGSDYSGEEYAGWLKEAGLPQVRQVPLPGATDLLVASR